MELSTGVPVFDPFSDRQPIRTDPTTLMGHRPSVGHAPLHVVTTTTAKTRSSEHAKMVLGERRATTPYAFFY